MMHIINSKGYEGTLAEDETFLISFYILARIRSLGLRTGLAISSVILQFLENLRVLPLSQ
jgi:hypothetical protein